MSQLLLIRHAQASFLAENYDQLSEKGIEQSRILGHYLADKKMVFDQLFVGPLRRQQQTYEEVRRVYQKRGLPIPEAIELVELEEYQGLDMMEEVKDQLAHHRPEFRQWFKEMEVQANHKSKMKMVVNFLHLWATDSLGFELPPGAQKWADFQAIAIRGLQKVLHGNDRGKTIAAFSSGGCIAAMLGEIVGTTDPGKAMGFNLVMRNTAISEVLFSGNRLSLKSFNTLPHLTDELITTM